MLYLSGQDEFLQRSCGGCICVRRTPECPGSWLALVPVAGSRSACGRHAARRWLSGRSWSWLPAAATPCWSRPEGTEMSRWCRPEGTEAPVGREARVVHRGLVAFLASAGAGASGFRSRMVGWRPCWEMAVSARPSVSPRFGWARPVPEVCRVVYFRASVASALVSPAPISVR